MSVKNELSQAEQEELINTARNVVGRAYAAYSGYRVAAAVLTNDGKVFSGVNVENASYGLSVCAERVAIGNAVTQGYAKGDIKAIAVYTPGEGDISPCGTCRQFIYEFDDGQGIRVLFKNNGDYINVPIEDLIPFGFNNHNLG